MKQAIRMVLVLALLAPTARAGSPWSQESGEGYAQAAFYWILPYDELFAGDDVFVTSREITDITLEAYLEHGIADAWTMIAAVPFKQLDAGSAVDGATVPVLPDEGSVSALGALRLGVKRQLTGGAWASAMQLDVELPTGSLDDATGLRSGIDGTAWVPSFSVGQGLANGYWFAHAGVAIRDEGYSEQFRGGFEYGRRAFGDRWLFVGGIEIVDSFRNGNRTVEPTNAASGLYLDRQEVVAPVLKAIYRAGAGWGVSGTVQGGFDGHLIARSPFLGIAVFTNYGG